METNKFEEHIKEKLEGREIHPSDSAWERISGRLEAVKTTSYKKYSWLAIAASFVGILVVSIFFMTRIDSPNVTEIVNTSEKIRANETKREAFETEDAVEGIVEESMGHTEINTEFKPEILPDHELAHIQREKSASATNDTAYTKKPHKVAEESIRVDAIVEAKLAEVIIKLDALEQNNAALEDAEVDSLLKIAQQEILTDKIFESGRAVDASELLAEVEDELDRSFRNQIFEKLKTGLLKIRTAVADRNN